jgi:hypothetical protein
MIDRLNKMYEHIKESVDSKLSDPGFKFTCKIDGYKLRECITEHFFKEESELIAEDRSRLFSKSVLTCLEVGLELCTKQNKLKMKEICREADFIIIKDKDNLLHVKSITIKVDPKKVNNELLESIKKCLKFYEFSCNKNSVKMPIKINFQFAD